MLQLTNSPIFGSVFVPSAHLTFWTVLLKIACENCYMVLIASSTKPISRESRYFSAALCAHYELGTKPPVVMYVNGTSMYVLLLALFYSVTKTN